MEESRSYFSEVYFNFVVRLKSYFSAAHLKTHDFMTPINFNSLPAPTLTLWYPLSYVLNGRF